MTLDRPKERTATFWMNVRFPTQYLQQGYEAPVAAYLARHDLGTIEGHGALFSKDGTEVLDADFSIAFSRVEEQTLADIIDILEEAGAPLGCSWSYDDTPEDKTAFGTLDALLVRFEGLNPENHAQFEDDLSAIIGEFHEGHSDTAGFQGACFTAAKATVSFHGFEYDDMVTWLDEICQRRAMPYQWSFERTSPRFEDLANKGNQTSRL